jgi:cell division protein FtsB
MKRYTKIILIVIFIFFIILAWGIEVSKEKHQNIMDEVEATQKDINDTKAEVNELGERLKGYM